MCTCEGNTKKHKQKKNIDIAISISIIYRIRKSRIDTRIDISYIDIISIYPYQLTALLLTVVDLI